MKPLREAGTGAPYEVAILGGGFAGICAAIRLKQEGIEDFVLVEKSEGPGGVWWDNRYPGVGCDIPSHLYSFSFFPNPDWSKLYSSGEEIRAYTARCIAHFGLDGQAHFSTRITTAHWDETRRLWVVGLADGRNFEARHFICGIGFLSVPMMPNIEGLDRFRGKVIHSARWTPETDLSGLRVACVGTGASAIQSVPELQKTAGHLTVYQRTPSWVVPRHQFAYSDRAKRLFRAFPFLNRLHRWQIYLNHDIRILAFKHRGWASKLFEAGARKWLEAEVPDPELRAKLTPGFPIGCKRILVSDDYLRSLGQPNVTVVPAGVERLTETGVVAAGVERPADAILLCTGFDLWNVLAPVDIRGQEGKSLAEAWHPVPEAYLGVMAAGFPNYYQLCGPNSGLGHNSIIFMIEAQVNYVLRKIAYMRKHGIAAMAVKPEASRRFNDRLQEELADSIWAGRCKSWYQGPDGRIAALWSGSTTRYWLRTLSADEPDYELMPPQATAAE